MKDSEVLEPKPTRPPSKRCFVETLDPEHQEPAPEEPARKRTRRNSQVGDWLDTVPAPPPKALAEISRPRSVPARFNDNQACPTVEDLLGYPNPPLAIEGMGDRRACDRRESGHDDESSSQRTGRTNATKISVAGPQYRSSLPYNSMKHDTMGLKMPQALQDTIDAQILASRTSPALSQDRLMQTMKAINKWESSTEQTNNFAYSDMFPVHRDGIGLGGNSQWSKAALPYDPDYGYPVSTPKPDFHAGYSHGLDGGFSAQQGHVIDHKQAKPYTQPATGNVMPFLAVEIKSEALGGTLFHAENQAIGSGTACVRSLEWLLDKAGASQDTRLTDTMNFSLAGTGRIMVPSVHWYSPDDRMYYMSGVKNFVTTNAQDIQACHSTVKNIVDWAVGPRHKKLKEVLQTLFPLSQQWSDKRTATAAELNDPDTYEEEDEDEGETIVIQQRASGGSKQPTQSFSSTRSLGSSGGGRSSTTKDTCLTMGSLAPYGIGQGSRRFHDRLNRHVRGLVSWITAHGGTIGCRSITATCLSYCPGNLWKHHEERCLLGVSRKSQRELIAAGISN